jgi:Xaa-Pro aminopeptidase
MFYAGVMNGQVSIGEMERRWKAIRSAMADRGIDVLLAYSASDTVGGHVRYLVDLPSAGSYPTTLIFPRDEAMTLVTHGGHKGDKMAEPLREGPLRGVKRILTTPAFSSVGYTKTYEAERANVALAPYATATVGLLAPTQIPFSMMDYLRQASLAKARIVDASDLLDPIKAVKSPEELGLMRKLAALQDEAISRAFAAIRPGMEEGRVAEIANQYMRFHGSQQGILMSGSGPVGTPSGIRVPFMQGRTIEAGDQYHLLLEVNSREGYYTEIGRTCVLGKVSARMQEEYAKVLEARQVTLDLLRPGVSCKEIWSAHNDFMRRNGLAEEKRLYSHSQGYDLVERPLVRWDEDMVLAENMVMAVHPMIATASSFTWICDNFLIRADGPPERLHRFDERIVEVN